MALQTLAVIAVIFMLRELREVLIPIVLAILMSYALGPVVDFLTRFVPRVVSTLVVMTLLVSTLAFSAYRLQDDFASVISEMPSAARRLRVAVRDSQQDGDGALGNLRRAAAELERAVRSATGDGAEAARPQPAVPAPTVSATDYFLQASLIVGQVITVFFLTLFLLMSEDLYKRKFIALAGPRLEKRRVTLKMIEAIGSQVEQFLVVLVFTSAVVAIVTWLALSWIGVRQPMVWGLIAGVFNSIPFFGPVVVTALLGTVALTQFGSLGQAAVVAGISLLITTLEGYLLTPILMSRASRMNAFTVFISILFWSWLWGIAGTLMAVPIMMAIKTMCDHIEGLKPVGDLLGDYEEPKAKNSAAA